MPTFVPVTYETHHNRRWQRHADYRFCSNESLVPIVLQELPKAVMALPLAFVKKENGFGLVAVLGLEVGKSLYITQDGRWLGPYVPATFRSYPFRLARVSNEQLVLCFDETSALITSEPEGEIFFSDDKQLAPAVAGVARLLEQILQGDLATTRALKLLQELNLIHPWEASFRREAGKQVVNGLFKIDENSLKELSGDSLVALNDAGALPIVYCQLLSMQHLPLLGQLADAHAKFESQGVAAKKVTESENLDIEFLNKNGGFNFGTFL